ncbi:hypothetical protein [Stakelama tenebrarum]|uniref:Response regulatory domain-containing protein n=1 Tax=Stakelama tenebrarum TaxID=2711215 RepID=A0A6G6Y474_9SPHN|nr:hypothetical protein [Sphingosinithalassobacter tenebrarum]QIG79732.1 hypothetical protein G5C33_07935 [Sphingosinithalassobacter tenebrarum]
MAKGGLFVLNIGEAGLRSILAARLSLIGRDVISVFDLADAALSRLMRDHPILLLDDATLERLPERALDRFVADERWLHVVVVSRRLPDDAEDCGRPCFLPRGEAPARLIALAEAWFTG